MKFVLRKYDEDVSNFFMEFVSKEYDIVEPILFSISYKVFMT